MERLKELISEYGIETLFKVIVVAKNTLNLYYLNCLTMHNRFCEETNAEEESCFPVDAILRILDMNITDKKLMPSGKKKRKNIQSKFKNTYSLIVAQAYSLLKQLLLSLDNNDRVKIEKEYKKSDEKWQSETKNLSKMLIEYESIDEKFSLIKEQVKQVKKETQNRSAVENLNKEKATIRLKRTKLQKGLLNKLKYKRFAFLVPAFRLVDDNPKAYLTRDRAIKFMNDKDNSCSKSRALTTLSLFLQKDFRIGLLIAKIVLALLSPLEKTDTSILLDKATVAFQFWMIKSAMGTKKKLFLKDGKKRAHIHKIFKEVCTSLQEKVTDDVTQEHLEDLEEISGTPKMNINAKRPAKALLKFPCKKRIKKI